MAWPPINPLQSAALHGSFRSYWRRTPAGSRSIASSNSRPWNVGTGRHHLQRQDAWVTRRDDRDRIRTSGDDGGTEKNRELRSHRCRLVCRDWWTMTGGLSASRTATWRQLATSRGERAVGIMTGSAADGDAHGSLPASRPPARPCRRLLRGRRCHYRDHPNATEGEGEQHYRHEQLRSVRCKPYDSWAGRGRRIGRDADR